MKEGAALRSEPVGASFRALLEVAASRGYGLAADVSGIPTEWWDAEFGDEHPATLELCSELGPVFYPDAAVVARFHAGGLGRSAVEKLFEGRLFGCGRRNDAANLTIFETDGSLWLWSVSSEFTAGVAEDLQSWSRLALQYPELADIIVSRPGYDLVHEPDGNGMYALIWEGDVDAQFDELADRVRSVGRGFESLALTVGAAILLLEAAHPDRLGDLHLPDLEAPIPPSRARRIESAARAALAEVRGRPEWRHHWDGLGHLSAVDREIDWYLQPGSSQVVV